MPHLGMPHLGMPHLGMPHLGMPHHYFRQVGVRAEFQKVVNMQHVNNLSPVHPSLP